MSSPLSPSTLRRSLRVHASSWILGGLAVAVVLSCRLLVAATLRPETGVAELRFLADHLALALGLLGALLGLCSPERAPAAGRPAAGRVVLLLPVPFLALLFLPTGLRPLAALLVLLPLAATAPMLGALWGSDRSPGDGSPLARWDRADFAAVTATLIVAVLLEPVDALGSLQDRWSLLAKALAVGVGIAWLRRPWPGAALVAGLAAVVVAGFHPFVGLSLLAVAAMESFLRAPRTRPLVAMSTLALLGLALWFSPAAALLPLAAWAQRGRRGWLATAVVAAGIGFVLAVPTPWPVAAAGLLVLVLVLPQQLAALLTDPSSRRVTRLRPIHEGLWRLFTAAVLAAVALRLFDPRLALVPVLLHLAAPLRTGDLETLEADPERRPARRDGTVWLHQARWLALWLIPVAGAALYPWLRPGSLWEQLAQSTDGATGSPVADGGLMVCSLLVLVTALLTARLRVLPWRTLLEVVVVTATVLTVLWSVATGPVTVVHRWPPQVLTASSPVATLAVPEVLSDDLGTGDDGSGDDGTNGTDRATGTVLWVDSFLANAAGVPAGTEVATVRLVTSSRRLTGSLVAGVHTGEWRLDGDAARDPDVATDPPTFSYWWSDEDQPRLGRRYRGRLLLEPATGGGAPDSGSSLVFRLAPGLPEGVHLRIDRVAVRPARVGPR